MFINILKIKGLATIWPSNKPSHKNCIVKDSKSGVEFEAQIPIPEVELFLQLKNHFPKEIPSDLHKAIENYGQYMYDKGSWDADSGKED